MNLITRCPACATTFRVSPAQLSARTGRVRCGKCAAAFDGVTNLLPDDVIAALPNEPSPQMGLFEIPEHSASPGDNDGIVAEAAEHVVPEIREPEPESSTASAAQHGPGAKEREEQEEVPAFLAPDRPRATHPMAWALLAMVASAALVLQAGLHFRTEVAVILPMARTHIQTVCGMLGCEVRPPRRADLMSIESSDLQADTQRPGVIVLNALLRNRAPFVQEYPDLELTLTDQGDQAVIRRVLRPGDYLPEKRASVAPGIGGGAEEAVRVYLETAGIPATGYQLFLFYPCPSPTSSAFWQLSYPARCLDPQYK